MHGRGQLRQAAGGLKVLAFWIAGILAGVSAYGGAVAASDRVALVLGMAKYQTISALKNTTNDARGIGETLTELGFETEIALDKTLPEMVALVNDFSFRAETANIALVYYAGHGVEVEGENYLVPIDVDIKAASEIADKALSLKRLLGAVDRARQLRIVILDSCRNNPFVNWPAPTTDVAALDPAAGKIVDTVRGAGLAAPSPDRGMMVMYAAKDGEVALDGKGDNSPFATALMQLLPEKNVEIGLMFRQVRDKVMAETLNRQQPHFYGSLSGVPFFLGGSDAPAPETGDKMAAWQSLAPDQAVQLAALADDGNTRAMIGLGYMSLSPDQQRYAPEKAFSLFQSAAAAGDPEAMFELGKLHEKGIGTPQNVAEALNLYKQSASLGFADAINDLGFLYYQGVEGLPRDPAKAIALFQQAADLRHPQAMFNVAALIDDGVIKGEGPSDAAGYLYLALRSGVEDVLNQLSTKPTMFSDATRKALQTKLAENKFYSGTIDGDIGSGTQRSMRIAFGRNE